MATHPIPASWRQPLERRIRQPWSRRKIIKTAAAVVLLAILTAAAVIAIYVAVLIARIRPTLPSMRQISGFVPVEASMVYSSDGTVLARLQMENRRVVPLSLISPYLKDATVAVEDSRFYQHGALDYRGVMRAAVEDIFRHGTAADQGASTITQQLARNISQFHVGREKTLARKVREAMVAARIEQAFTKDQILALYLNQIYYGSGAYGAEAAARTYFGKSAMDLTLPEAALIAGLPQRPYSYSPYEDPAAARDRRNVVLQRMLDTGKVTRAQYQQASAAPIKLAGRHMTHMVYKAPYFVDWVVEALVKQYGVDRVYSGWKIYTTLNWPMQEAAERAVRGGLSYGATQGALVAIDPHSGEVRAMVGGVDYNRDRFNIITQGARQPGSAFKVIVYSAAIDTGAVNLGTELRDERQDFGDRYRHWYVRNYGGGYSHKEVTVEDAIVHSINTIAVQVAMETGIDKVSQYARAFGISTDLTPYPSLALGASAVRPIEFCSAFTVFPNMGERYQPVGISRIEDASGSVVFKDNPFNRDVPSFLQPSTIQAMNLALREVVERGTGTAANYVSGAFGKTGTTSDERDAWFAGYTKELTAVVWVGSPYRDAHGLVHFRPMPGATGGRAAAPIWARFMEQAVPIQQRVDQKRGVRLFDIPLPPPMPRPVKEVAPPPEETAAQPPPPLPYTYLGPVQPPSDVQAQTGTDYGPQVIYAPDADQPQGRAHRSPRSNADQSDMVTVRICVDSGMKATEWCPNTIEEQLPRSQVPRRYCPLHHAPSAEQDNSYYLWRGRGQQGDPNDDANPDPGYRNRDSQGAPSPWD